MQGSAQSRAAPPTPCIWRATRTAKARPSPRTWPWCWPSRRSSWSRSPARRASRRRRAKNGAAEEGREGSAEQGDPGDRSEENFPRDVQRDHAQGDSRGVRASAAGGYAIWWMRSRRGACWTASWATRFRRCCGTRCAAGFPPGRVQTVALRLIVEREQEIRAFVPEEYWTIHAHARCRASRRCLRPSCSSTRARISRFTRRPRRTPSWPRSKKRTWQVASVTQKEKRRNAPPPFTTSKLQQAAYNRLRYTAKRTMSLAQRLYEGVELGEEGSVALITYMRTDSVHVSNDALAQVRELIRRASAPSYLPEKPNFYKSKKDAQEAHEAVRPTDVMRAPEDVRRYLDDDLFKLYQLIWQRFVASQMLPAVFDQTTIDISAGDYTFRANGLGAEIRRLPARLPDAGVHADREDDEKDEEGEGRALPRVQRGPDAAPGHDSSRPAFHRAAAALHRRHAGEGAGRKGHRPAVDLRLDHFDDRRARVRHQGPGALFADHAGRKSQRAAGEELRGYFRRTLHGAPGRGTGRNRGRQAALARSREGILGKIRRGSGSGQRRDGLVQGRDSHGKEVREVRRGRTAGAHQPPRLFPGLLALSGLRFHPGSLAGTARGDERRAQDRSTATTAARRWSSSAGASASSWPARAIRIARRRAAWWTARAWRGSRTSRWTRSAPTAARNW